MNCGSFVIGSISCICRSWGRWPYVCKIKAFVAAFIFVLFLRLLYEFVYCWDICVSWGRQRLRFVKIKAELAAMCLEYGKHIDACIWGGCHALTSSSSAATRSSGQHTILSVKEHECSI